VASFASTAFDVASFSELAFFFDGDQPEPEPEVDAESDAAGWRFYLRYEAARERRRRKREEQLEAEEAVQALPPVEKEIAQILHKQERIDESKTELRRLKALVDQYRQVPNLSTRATEAYERARVRGLRSDLAKLDKELKRMLEDEEMAVLMLLLND
jgi:regulator of protease activity HflC (stomatin/prohibitin superfamily)